MLRLCFIAGEVVWGIDAMEWLSGEVALLPPPTEVNWVVFSEHDNRENGEQIEE